MKRCRFGYHAWVVHLLPLDSGPQWKPTGIDFLNERRLDINLEDCEPSLPGAPERFNLEPNWVEGNWDRMQNYSAVSLLHGIVGSANVGIHGATTRPSLPFSQFVPALAPWKFYCSGCYYQGIAGNKIRLSHAHSSDILQYADSSRVPTLSKSRTLKTRSSLQIPEDQGSHSEQPAGVQQSNHTRKEALGTAESIETLTGAIKDLKSTSDKPEICTADELHYISVPGTDWKLALWRYHPRSGAPVRNHPLLLLSGVGTNAIGFDLDPSVSMARFMAEEGFDTWILEVRGAGLSKKEGQPPASQIASSSNGTKLIKGDLDSQVDVGETTKLTDPNMVTSLSNTVFRISEKLQILLTEGQTLLFSAPLLERISRILDNLQLSERYDEFQERLAEVLNERQGSAIAKRIADLSKRLLKLLEDGQQLVSPQIFDLQDRLVINTPKIAELQERLLVTIDDFQQLVDLVVTYDWDFDNYLEEDIPAAMEYIRSQSRPKDGKMHAIGHSMGGIVLYAFLASGKGNSCLASAVTLASSLDYNVSDSSLKLLLPLADPAQALNVPAVPLGALMAAVYPLTINPPFALSWLSLQVSAQNMMEPELLRKLVLNNFCTIPAKLLLHLTSVFQPGGLRNRGGTIFYKDHIHTCKTPVLAIAGDEDLICPRAAVLDTVKALPQDLVTYKVFGGDNNHHYGHYDLVCGRMAKQEIFPCIQDFLVRYDNM